MDNLIKAKDFKKEDFDKVELHNPLFISVSEDKELAILSMEDFFALKDPVLYKKYQDVMRDIKEGRSYTSVDEHLKKIEGSSKNSIGKI